MDGTIIDSTNAIIKHWHQIGKEIGVDPNVILQTSHGRRTIDVLEILEPKLATWECECSSLSVKTIPMYPLPFFSFTGCLLPISAYHTFHLIGQ